MYMYIKGPYCPSKFLEDKQNFLEIQFPLTWFFFFWIPKRIAFNTRRKIYCYWSSLHGSVGSYLSKKHTIQGHHFSLLQHETEKLRNDIEKMRSELRCGYIVIKQLILVCCDVSILFVLDLYCAKTLIVVQVWDRQSHCWAAVGFESWKGVNKETYLNLFCSEHKEHLFSLISLSLSVIIFLTFNLYWCRRIRDELANQNAETNNLTNKLDRVSDTSIEKWIGLGWFSPWVFFFFNIYISYNIRKFMLWGPRWKQQNMMW